jgi:hypothetical protein
MLHYAQYSEAPFFKIGPIFESHDCPWIFSSNSGITPPRSSSDHLPRTYKTWAIMASMQARKDEILAKKAKLAELKRQRELRTREVSASRQSIGGTSDVQTHVFLGELC